jgi:hypothetical protein
LLLWPTESEALPREADILGRRRSLVLFFPLVVQPDGKALGVFDLKLSWDFALLDIIHELLVFWIFVLPEFSIIDLEAILPESDGALDFGWLALIFAILCLIDDIIDLVGILDGYATFLPSCVAACFFLGIFVLVLI